MLEKEAGRALRDKFRAMSKGLRSSFEAHVAGGRHTYEKGLRNEEVLIKFLAGLLPPKYGVSRGEVVDSKGGVARQADVVIYDAHHAPLLQAGETSQVFPAESVYAVIELKPSLNRTTLAEAVEMVRSAKALDRSAVVTTHGGHRLFGGPQPNPPLFGAIFALKSSHIERLIVPALADHHGKLRPEHWVDCICVLDSALVYHFLKSPAPSGADDWAPTVLCKDARLGYYDSREDTLLLFYLFLLFQLNAKELFPPDFIKYVEGFPVHGAKVYLGEPRRWRTRGSKE